MDVLSGIFPEWPPQELEIALENAGQDINMAVEILLELPPPSQYQHQHHPEHRGPQRNRHKALEFSPTPSEEVLDQLPDPADEIFADWGKSTDVSDTTSGKKALSKDEAIANLLSLFPDACTEFLTENYQKNHILHGVNIVEFLANKFLEGGYTRAELVGQKRKRKSEHDIEAPTNPNYESPDRPLGTLEYRGLVRGVLAQEFSRMPLTYIDRVLQQHHYFLAVTYTCLLDAQWEVDSNAGSSKLPYKRLVNPRKTYNGPPKMGQCWSRVSDELDYSRVQAQLKEMKIQMEKDAELASKLNEQEHEESKMLIECQCCFSDVPFDNMTHCGEGEHFFCLDCARRNAENEIGNSRHKLLCMDGSGCKAEFSQGEMLKIRGSFRFLDEKTAMALSKLQQEDALRMADIAGLVRCPFCDYAEICRPIEEDKEFRCQNSKCMETSCRHCEKKSHIPLSCKEASKDDKITVRHAIEEAMTEAMIRRCNKCKSPFIKEYGCNKMVCTKSGCRSMQCYVCSRTVKGYEHFNDKARGGTSGNCPLFDNVEERHEEEIQRAAEGAKEKLRAEHPGLDDTDLEIHLSDEVKRREQERRLAAQPAHLRNPPNRGAAVNIPYIPPVPPLPPPPAGHQVPRAPPAPPAAPIQRSRVILRHGRQPAAQPAPPAPQQFEAEAMPFAMPAALPANYPYVMGGFQGLEQLHDNLQMLQQFAGIQPPHVVQQPPFYQAPPATPAADRVLPHMPIRNVTPKNPIHRRPPPPKTNID